MLFPAVLKSEGKKEKEGGKRFQQRQRLASPDTCSMTLPQEMAAGVRSLITDAVLPQPRTAGTMYGRQRPSWHMTENWEGLLRPWHYLRHQTFAQLLGVCVGRRGDGRGRKDKTKWNLPPAPRVTYACGGGMKCRVLPWWPPFWIFPEPGTLWPLQWTPSARADFIYNPFLEYFWISLSKIASVNRHFTTWSATL